MDIMELGAIGELVGGVAVVVTLVYLVVQVRQNTDQLQQATEVARGSAEIETAKMNLTYYAEYVRNPSLLPLYERGFNDPQSLTQEERHQWTMTVTFWFHVAQGNYRQYKRGLLQKESWEPIERGLVGALQLEGGRAWWNEEAAAVAVLATDFRDHVESLAKTQREDAWTPRTT